MEPVSRGRGPLSRWRRLLMPVLVGAAALLACGAAAPKNRLAGETSPYLLQHAANPVDWYPWGAAAFQKARKENKPLFLSVGYSSCHWCHVMSRESFQDAEVARELNEGFVAVKVDREERPDVDDLYMTALLALDGRGGWPLSAFLLPDGKPFTLRTYERRDSFLEVLRRIRQGWADPKLRADIDRQADRLTRAVGHQVKAPRPGSLSPRAVTGAAARYLSEADGEHGGFGVAPKFPSAGKLALLLAQQRRVADPKALKAITLSLDRMARGGIHDQIGGGFHRYSTDAKWLVPHFEKMLYDQALLAWVYLEAYDLTRRPLYRRVATETLNFTLRELRSADGAFHSSLGAESGGVGAGAQGTEGAFYLWKPEEITAALGAEQGPRFSAVFDVTATGHTDGHSIPNLLSGTPALDAPDFWKQADRWRALLRARRAGRPAPAVDDKVLASWNGLMIRALARGYELLGEDRYRTAAAQAALFVLGKMRRGEGEAARLVHSYRAGKTQPQSFLEDYSFVCAGLLDLHRATGEERWLNETEALVDQMLADFWDEGSGTLFSTPHTHEALLARANRVEDSDMPAPQSLAAVVLVNLSRRTRKPALALTARRLLEAHAATMDSNPGTAPFLLLAADAYFTADDTSPSDDPVTATVRLLSPLRPGGETDVEVRLDIRKGWHINGPAPSDPNRVPTRMELLASGGYRQISTAYPAAPRGKAGAGYTGTVRLRLRVAMEQAGQDAPLQLRLTYQPCTDKLCSRPVRRVLTVIKP